MLDGLNQKIARDEQIRNGFMIGSDIFVGSYKAPRSGRLIYKTVFADNASDALKMLPSQIIHRKKIYFHYGLTAK